MEVDMYPPDYLIQNDKYMDLQEPVCSRTLCMSLGNASWSSLPFVNRCICLLHTTVHNR